MNRRRGMDPCDFDHTMLLFCRFVAGLALLAVFVGLAA